MSVAATVRRRATEHLEVRRDGGYFDQGRYIANEPEVFGIRANVQPAPSQSISRLPEGTRRDDVIVLYATKGSELRTAKAGDGGHSADRVVWCGREYEIATVEIWPSYRRYMATRFGQ